VGFFICIYLYDMKFIISENRINDLVIKYLNKTYDINNIHWTYGMDDNYDEDENSVEVYFGDYGDGEEFFRWYNSDYFVVKCDRCPLLDMDTDIKENLTNLFGNKWEEPFKEWVKTHFNLDVKTIE